MMCFDGSALAEDPFFPNGESDVPVGAPADWVKVPAYFMNYKSASVFILLSFFPLALCLPRKMVTDVIFPPWHTVCCLAGVVEEQIENVSGFALFFADFLFEFLVTQCRFTRKQLIFRNNS